MKPIRDIVQAHFPSLSPLQPVFQKMAHYLSQFNSQEYGVNPEGLGLKRNGQLIGQEKLDEVTFHDLFENDYSVAGKMETEETVVIEEVAEGSLIEEEKAEKSSKERAIEASKGFGFERNIACDEALNEWSLQNQSAQINMDSAEEVSDEVMHAKINERQRAILLQLRQYRKSIAAMMAIPETLGNRFSQEAKNWKAEVRRDLAFTRDLIEGAVLDAEAFQSFVNELRDSYLEYQNSDIKQQNEELAAIAQSLVESTREILTQFEQKVVARVDVLLSPLGEHLNAFSDKAADSLNRSIAQLAVFLEQNHDAANRANWNLFQQKIVELTNAIKEIDGLVERAEGDITHIEADINRLLASIIAAGNLLKVIRENSFAERERALSDEFEKALKEVFLQALDSMSSRQRKEDLPYLNQWLDHYRQTFAASLKTEATLLKEELGKTFRKIEEIQTTLEDDEQAMSTEELNALRERGLSLINEGYLTLHRLKRLGLEKPEWENYHQTLSRLFSSELRNGAGRRVEWIANKIKAILRQANALNSKTNPVRRMFISYQNSRNRLIEQFMIEMEAFKFFAPNDSRVEPYENQLNKLFPNFRASQGSSNAVSLSDYEDIDVALAYYTSQEGGSETDCELQTDTESDDETASDKEKLELTLSDTENESSLFDSDVEEIYGRYTGVSDEEIQPRAVTPAKGDRLLSSSILPLQKQNDEGIKIEPVNNKKGAVNPPVLSQKKKPGFWARNKVKMAVGIGLVIVAPAAVAVGVGIFILAAPVVGTIAAAAIGAGVVTGTAALAAGCAYVAAKCRYPNPKKKVPASVSSIPSKVISNITDKVVVEEYADQEYDALKVSLGNQQEEIKDEKVFKKERLLQDNWINNKPSRANDENFVRGREKKRANIKKLIPQGEIPTHARTVTVFS